MKMNRNVLTRITFIVWIATVAALSVMPHTEDLLMFVTLTRSGFVMHCFAYFVGMLLCYLAFDRKNISFVLWTGVLVLLASVVLEGVQFYLPYRTFNVYDVVANGVGILLFVFIHITHSKMKKHRLSVS